QAVIHWAVFWVCPLGPQHEVAVGEGEVTSALVTPLPGAHGAGLILGLARITPRCGCCIVPAGGRDVVAIRTVSGLQLPVSVVGVGRRTAQNLKAVWRLVNEHIHDRA